MVEPAPCLPGGTGEGNVGSRRRSDPAAVTSGSVLCVMLTWDTRLNVPAPQSRGYQFDALHSVRPSSSRLLPLMQRGPAVFEQAQVNQLLFQLLHGGLVQGLDHLVEQEIGKLFPR